MGMRCQALALARALAQAQHDRMEKLRRPKSAEEKAAAEAEAKFVADCDEGVRRDMVDLLCRLMPKIAVEAGGEPPVAMRLFGQILWSVAKRVAAGILFSPDKTLQRLAEALPIFAPTITAYVRSASERMAKIAEATEGGRRDV